MSKTFPRIIVKHTLKVRTDFNFKFKGLSEMNRIERTFDDAVTPSTNDYFST